MSKAKPSLNDIENQYLSKCYNCNSEIKDTHQKYCENCNVILNPNDLKWRNSFFLCICVLCLIPLLISLFITLVPI